jgi:hypothetical protein
MPSERSSAKSSMSAAAFCLLAVNGVGEAELALSSFAGHAKAQGERLSGGGAAVAFGARKLAHPGIEQPRPLRARSFAVPGVGGSEIAVGEAFLERSPRRFAGEARRVPIACIARPSSDRAT